MPGLPHGKGVDDMVQGASQVVEGVAEQQRPSQRIGLDFESKAELVHAAIGIALSDDTKWITIAPPVGLAVERAQVLVCPSELSVMAERPMKGHEVSLPPQK